MMTCTNCSKREASVDAIINGQLHKNLCEPCYNLLVLGKKQSSAAAQFERERDIEDHLGDIQQPIGADGKPNRGFIELYPDKAKQMFSDEELRLHG